MRHRKLRYWVLCISVLLCIGIVVSFLYEQKHSGAAASDSDSEMTILPKNQAIEENQDLYHQIQQGFWQLVDNNVGEMLAKRMENVDLSQYEILEVECTQANDLGAYLVGDVDVIMKNRESGMYDWLSFSLLLKGTQVIDARLIETQYYDFNHAVQVTEQEKEKVKQFITETFQNGLPLRDFGYRYRNSLKLVDSSQYSVKGINIIKGNERKEYIAEIAYSDFLKEAHVITSLVVIRDYNGKMQIEDVRVIEKVAIGAEGT